MFKKLVSLLINIFRTKSLVATSNDDDIWTNLDGAEFMTTLPRGEPEEEPAA